MANQSVLELAVGTGKWDAGLKKAKQTLDNFTQANGGLQQALGKDSASMQKFVQMMGKMDSTAKTAKGQMNDYKSTIEQLTMQYNRMTEAQKKTIGQDYLKSIDQLKQKYQAVNKEIQDINKSLSSTKAPEVQGSGQGISSMMAVFGGNLMTKAAEMVASLGTEVVSVMNESAELAKAAEGIQIAFARLGRGDLLDGLREATHGTVSDLELMKAAVKFQDFKLPLEELGTMLAFAQQKAKDTGQSVDYMVDSIVTGLGRKSLMILDNLGLSAAQVRERMKETGDMTKAVGDIIREEMKKAGDYVETASDRATKANVELENAMLELGTAMRETFGYTGWSDMAAGIKTELVGALTFTIETMGRAKDAWNTLMQAMGIQDKPQKPKPTPKAPDGTYFETTDADGNLIEAGRWMNGKKVVNTMGVTVTGTNKSDEKKKTPKGGGTSIQTGPKASSFETFIGKSILGADALKGSDLPDTMSVWAQMTDEAKKSMLGLAAATEDLGDAQAKLGEQKVAEEMTNLTSQTDKMIKSAQMTAEVVGSIGQAFNSIEDPAAKVAGTIMQAIANVALGYSNALTMAQEAGGPWGWIAFAASGLATMVSTISAIHSATGYANGGEIKGNSYSGDNIMANGGSIGLNAGEIVLNRAMAGNIASQLEGGSSTIDVKGILQGENILIATDRALKRQGKQLMTWGRG